MAAGYGCGARLTTPAPGVPVTAPPLKLFFFSMVMMGNLYFEMSIILFFQATGFYSICCCFSFVCRTNILIMCFSIGFDHCFGFLFSYV